MRMKSKTEILAAPGRNGALPPCKIWLLGGAAVHRCDNQMAFSPASAAEGLEMILLSECLGGPTPCQL
jgi:hypothetical protein